MPTTPQETRTRFDDDNDGTIDRIAFDNDGDGTADRIDHYTYDDDGNRSLTRRDFDLDDDGNIDRIDHYTFDDDGNRRVTRRDFDLDDDGTIDRTAHLNAAGRWERVERDADDDGNIDRINHYAFAADGTRSLTRIAFDLDGDGNIDRTAHLNAAGRWERVERDADDDGNIDRINHYAFDDDGTRSLTRRDFDVDGDGNIDRSEAYSYDANGNRTRFDDDNDGRIDRVAFDLDGDGNIDRTAHLNAAGRWERVEQDVDDDGNIDRIDHYTFDDGTRSLTRTESYSYDASGNRTRTAFDDDADGTADRSEAYSYNSNGDRIRTRFDDNNDGRIDRIAFDVDGDGNIDRTAHLNAAGRWERVEQDVDDDGNIDRIDHYAFAADGARSLTRSGFDDDGDGNIDRSEAYSYDANGNRIRTRFDDDNDGRIDRIAFDVDGDGNIDRTAHLNAAGRWERVEQDVDDDGNIDRIDHYTFAADGTRSLTRSESYSYDASGNRTRTAFDDDADGTADRSEAYIHDANGNRIRTRFDDDNDGRIDRVAFDLDGDGNIDRTAHLNEAGRWERVEQDVDDDGNIDRIDHYTFAADGARSLTRSGFDDDGDGNIDRSEAYNYNSNGNRIRTRFDDDNDGRIDRVAFDLDGDGNIDRIDHYAFAADGTRSLTRSESYSYDASGNRTRTAFDDDADGTADRNEAYIHDANGNRIRTRFDDDNDGRVDRVAFDVDGDGNIDRTAHLNAAGRWERVEQDVDDDGNIDRIDHYTFAADGARSLTRSGFDDDGDGNIDRSEAYSYDANGNRTRFDDDNDGRIDRVAFDVDGDGNIDRTAHLNAAGRWERVEQDVDDDGNIDRIDHYAFAADGTRSLTRSGFDDDGDGNIDRSEAYIHDANGNRILTWFDDNNDGTIDRTAFDPDGDGNIDRVDHYAFDDDGTRRVTRIDFDLDDDGRIDRRGFDTDGDGNIDRSEAYSYDANGNRIRTRFDTDGDGNIDRSEAYSYDANGNRTRIRFDDDNDGRVDRVAFDVDGDGNIDRTAHLNAAGRWERVEQDVDDDGNIDRIDHYAFAADGARSLTRSEFDDDGDGNIDRSEAYSYDANGNRTRIRFDDDNDGRVDRVAFDVDGDGNIDRTAHLNAAGRWERVEQDVDDDGNIDRIDHYAFAADGARSLTRSEFDDDGDGNIDRSEAYSYNSNGDRIRTRFDDDNDGRIDRVAFDLDGDGNIDRIDHYTFDDDGNRSLTRRDFDDDDDGNIDRSTVSVAENQVAAYEAAATDADGDPLRYSLSGTDAALFTIDANTGEVRFMAAPDFEAPGDDDGDNVYDITVTASDGDNSANHNVAITVTNENDNAPAFTSPATVSVAENQVAAYEAAAADADGDPLRYSLSGTDAGLFTIDANTGEVRFRAGPDFEMPGDDDGDNVYDITVAASDGTNQTDQPVAITVTTDEYNPIPLSSLDGTTGFILNGIDGSDRSGTSVSSAGDVNGDGYDDLIIGAWAADPNGDNRAGETYLVYGGASAPGTGGRFNLSALDGTNGFILNGIDARDQSGASVSSAGDVNGDGYDDLIIGAGSADPNEDSSAGETYLVYGGASAPGTGGRFNLSTLDGTNGFILNGIDRSDSSGASVSSAGDVNGDGYDDLIIGAWAADPNGVSQAGETYIVYGGANAPGTGGVLDLGALDGSNGFILAGIDQDDFSGSSVSSAGDVNGDGYDDLIIGAWLAAPNGDSFAGETYLVYGGANAPGTGGRFNLSALDGTNGFILNGIDADDRSGYSVSSAGDVNGDGYNDLIIGAFEADPNGDNGAGETYIVYGGANAPGTGGRFNLSTLDGTNGFILNGIDTYDGSGISVSSAGDVNGDGYDDLIIGANSADPNGFRSGETYLVYGGASAPGTGGVLDLSALDGSNGFTLTGIDAGDDSGRSVSSAGDVNGDGYDDLIIGAREADPNEDSNAGETYVVYGGATGTESLVPVTASGTAAAADNFTGNAGADSFTDIATNDVVRGGAGDDTISVTALDFAAIDGGTGQDRLILDGAGLSLDLTGAGHAGVDSVEILDLSGTGGNTLVLDALAVFDLTEEREGGVASLDVLGDADDRVDLGGSSFALTGTVTEDGTTYNVYRDGNAQVRVEAGVQVQIPVSTLPTFTSPATVSVAENQAAAYEAVATDADGDPLRYSLSGTDAALFTIDANTGEVRFRAAPDFEVPGDADRDNVYDITVTASDGTNQTDQSVAITVTNENDNVPIFTSPATVSVAENQVAAYGAAATDADGDSLRYSLSGTDAALFTIDANTGEVRFMAAPDFEAPGDADRDNVYDITVTASDGTNRTEQAVAITVTNENDNAPTFTSPATVSVAENQVAAYEVAAADADGDPLSYSLSGTDAALFTIDANTGEVSFRAAPDFEMPGDADRDNVHDITVTASDGDNSTNHNVAITVTTDEYNPIPLSSLDGTTGFILNGIDGSDYSGWSVSSAGDVNGDGYDDLIIGALGADPNGDSNAGETYLVYGGASAPGTGGVLDLSTLDGTNGFILTGIDRRDYSGISVSSAGDVNGDGYDDMIIGAFGADPNGDNNAGETYVVYGGASAPGTGGRFNLSTLDGTNGFILAGIDAGDYSGRFVSSAGDVNGDGYDDLIIGAWAADPNGDNRAGETYVIYGGASAPGTDGVLDLGALNGSNGFILAGIDQDDRSGFSVSSAGDVNGDGYNDLIIGAFEADPNGDNGAGETYIVYGGANAPGTGGRFNLSTLNGTSGFILTGIDASDFSGWSVSSAGDVNGDGYDDLIIGAPTAAPGEDSFAGETYIVYGGASAPGTDGVLDLSALNGTNGFILAGIDALDQSGISVSSAGDVNGDGYDDLIIGAIYGNPNGDSQAGETYLVYGGASAPGTGGVLDLSALDGSNGFTLNGIDEDDRSGFSVSSAGDVNGDGYDDLIIGAPGADPNGDNRAGETYIVYGGATGTESLVPVTAQGTAAAAGDNFTGNAGADSFTDIATNDVVRGGAGDDTISVTALDFAAVDGGTGQDRLILDGAGLSLDLTGAGHAGVDSVEVFDLSGTGGNTLVLDALAVFDLTEERAGGVASLDVLGDADDRVDLGGSNFALTGTVTEDGTTYNVYRDGNAQLRVEDGVSVTLAATPAGSMGTGTAFGAGANGDGDPERIGDRDASGLSVRLDEDTDGDGDTDRVTYEGDADFAGNFPNNIGLEVVRLDGLDGAGSTDLTIPDEFVFAGNPSGNQVRIEGGNTDTLRFDMDDFAEAPEPVGFGGESYRGFASDDQTWSFLVDADVMLFDI